MAETSLLHLAPIEQSLDVENLAVLTDDQADTADEEGLLAGNQHYQDLEDCGVADLEFAIQLESQLVEHLVRSADLAREESAIAEERPAGDVRAALWHLDVGLAAAVVALVVLGTHTVSAAMLVKTGAPLPSRPRRTAPILYRLRRTPCRSCPSCWCRGEAGGRAGRALRAVVPGVFGVCRADPRRAYRAARYGFPTP